MYKDGQAAILSKKIPLQTIAIATHEVGGKLVINASVVNAMMQMQCALVIGECECEV